MTGKNWKGIIIIENGFHLRKEVTKMPYGDGTGPLGLGPMTGRAAGYCAGFPVPGYMNPYVAIPCRWFGRGRGFRHWYWATGLPGWARASIGLPAWGGWVYPGFHPYYGQELTPQKEAEILKKQAEAIQEELKSINERIKTLEKLASEEKK